MIGMKPFSLGQKKEREKDAVTEGCFDRPLYSLHYTGHARVVFILRALFVPTVVTVFAIFHTLINIHIGTNKEPEPPGKLQETGDGLGKCFPSIFTSLKE